MTLASIQQFSTTASSNTDIDGISVATGWPPANVGPAFRELMALLASALQPLLLDVGGQSAVTLTAAQASAQFVIFYGSLSGTCTVTIPNAPFLGMVRNVTGGAQNIVLVSGGGTTIAFPADGFIRFYYCDGAGNIAVQTTEFAFTPVQQGGGIGQGTNKIYAGWNSAEALVKLTVDVTDEGGILTNTNVFSGWLNFTGGRAVNTVFVNTASVPISVSVILSETVVNTLCSFVINGLTVASVQLAPVSLGITDIRTLSAIVPPGDSYEISCSPAPANVVSWAELS